MAIRLRRRACRDELQGRLEGYTNETGVASCLALPT